jgi:hypothetical protein
VVLDGSGIFPPYILGSELDVEHSGVNLGVSHQMLESGQGNARTHHVSAEGMPKPMRVGVGDAAAQTMMPKERAEPGEAHRLSTLTALQGNE